MDIGLYLILGLLLLWVCGAAGAIAGTVDTFQFAPEVWAEAGYLRTSWIWQAALVVCVPGALVYSGIYFFRVRPRLLAVQRAIARTDPDYPEWVARRRWYDRLSRARRSPYEWNKAARRWWMWIPSVLASVAISVFYLYGATRYGEYGSRAVDYTVVALWSVSGLLSAARCGFWYAEYMRLTGRRPERGGPLVHPGAAPTNLIGGDQAQGSC